MAGCGSSNKRFADVKLGYPIATIPVGMVKYSDRNARPWGLCVTAAAGQEELLLRFMKVCETAFGPRAVPRPLLQWDDG